MRDRLGASWLWVTRLCLLGYATLILLICTSSALAWDRFGGDEGRTRLLDETPPTWLAYGVWPPSTTVGRPVAFHSHWQDGFTNLKRAILRLNVSGQLVYFSLELSGTSDWANFTLSDLSSGTYSFTISASDIYDNWNSTPAMQFEVARAPSHIELWLDGQRGHRTYDLGQPINLTVRLDVPGREVSLWANFTRRLELLARGPAPLSLALDSRQIGLGTFRVKANWTGDEYYEPDSDEWTLTVADLSPPRWSAMRAEPPSGTPWRAGQRYRFSVRWVDNVAVDTVLFEHDFLGPLANYTARLDGVWSVDVFNLTRGHYRWRSLANDSAGNWNSTPVMQFEVARAPSHIELWLDGQRGHRTYDLGQPINLTVRLDVPGREVSLWANFTRRLELLARGPAPLSLALDSRQIGLGTFRVKAYWPGDAEYAPDTDEWTLTVADLSPPRWSAMRAEPPSGTLWFIRDYHFYVTWWDNWAVDVVLIQHNFTGEWQNRTMQLREGEWWYAHPNLRVGSYGWRSLANDSAGNWNSTGLRTYVVREWIPFRLLVLLAVALLLLAVLAIWIWYFGGGRSR